MLPTIEASKKIVMLIDTTLGYLWSQSNDMNVSKDTVMPKKLNDITALHDRDKNCVLYTIDHLLAFVKTQALYK